MSQSSYLNRKTLLFLDWREKKSFSKAFRKTMDTPHYRIFLCSLNFLNSNHHYSLANHYSWNFLHGVESHQTQIHTKRSHDTSGLIQYIRLWLISHCDGNKLLCVVNILKANRTLNSFLLLSKSRIYNLNHKSCECVDFFWCDLGFTSQATNRLLLCDWWSSLGIYTALEEALHTLHSSRLKKTPDFHKTLN